MRDLGSRAMRWGSSPHARTKKRVIRTDGPLFGTSERTRKGGGRAADAKNMPVACFLARGRVPGFLGAPRTRRGVDKNPAPASCGGPVSGRQTPVYAALAPGGHCVLAAICAFLPFSLRKILPKTGKYVLTFLPIGLIISIEKIRAEALRSYGGFVRRRA